MIDCRARCYAQEPEDNGQGDVYRGLFGGAPGVGRLWQRKRGACADFGAERKPAGI